MNLQRFAMLLVSVLGLNIFSCTSITGQNAWDDYWYGGEAELSRYALEQARYGEIHKGESVLIFVTEPFRTDRQVKYEGGDRSNVQSVLKLNLTKKFFTGIYPYSMMASIFTPASGNEPSLKVTTTSQEWCGHTFSQLNLRKNKYQGELRSYFQEEGDRNFTLEMALLEDELWTKIRISPEDLPVGKISLVPGTMYLRLAHQPFMVTGANAKVENHQDASLSAQPLKKYTVEYADIDRKLVIMYESKFPYAIVGWEEHSRNLVTKARRTHSIKSAYWGQHDVADAPLRKKLGLNAANY